MDKNAFIDRLLPFVSKASRYLGNEVNAVRKNLSEVDVRFALAFPDAYEVGMSHMGLHILYHILNARSWIACERAFAPWPDLEALMRGHAEPLATLESHLPLRDCDIIGFSLEYELCYATVLRMLDLAGIPLESSRRPDTFPLIIAGGPSTYNPEPVADFIDAFVIGDGEDVLVQLCETVRRCKRQSDSKADILEALTAIDGIYVPAHYHVIYNSDHTILEIAPLKKAPMPVRKRTVSDFSRTPFCTEPIVPYMPIIHDRAAVEIARGCVRGCRFCMAGMIYRPLREKDPRVIRQLSTAMLRATGHDELALASLSSGDYTGIASLLTTLMGDHCPDCVAVSFPSLRAGTLTAEMLQEIKQVRKTGFTIAPEAGTQRLRDVINKGLEEEDILTTARQVFAAGWNLLKLYFMIGLPTEQEDDLEGIITLCKTIAAVDRRKQLNVSISNFVPKPHTPFQWVRQDSPDEIAAKQRLLKTRLRSRAMRVKWHDTRLSELEGIFSRGDRILGAVLREALRRGAGFDAWTEHFNADIWDSAFAACGIDKQFYLRERTLTETLPWAHISCGVRNEFLVQELDKSLRGETSPSCRNAACGGCGVCNGRERVVELCTPSALPPAPQTHRPEPTPDACFGYRLYYCKIGPARFLSHLELSTCIARAMRRAQIPLRHTRGFHPHPRIVFLEALPVGIESLQQGCDLELIRPVPPDQLLSMVNPHLPEGLSILSVEKSALKNTPPTATIARYMVSVPDDAGPAFPDSAMLSQRVAEWNAREERYLDTVKKGRPVRFDLTHIVRECRTGPPLSIDITIDTSGSVPRIIDIAGHILHLGDREKPALHIVKMR